MPAATLDFAGVAEALRRVTVEITTDGVRWRRAIGGD